MPLTLQQVSENNTRGSCWVIINNHVYDVTEFLGRHPGGSSIILKYAGRDATAAYEPIHPADALKKHLHPSCHLGPVDHASAEQLDSESRNRRKTQDELRVEKALKRRPPLERMLSLKDLENVARQVLPLKTLSFYSSGADDEVALAQNALAYSRFFFTPRVLRPVSLCDPSTKILGFPSPLPIYVSAAALAKLGHPLGEINITKACGKFKHGGPIIQMVATYSSVGIDELAGIADERNRNRNSRGGGGNAGNAAQQTLFFQLYKPAKVSDARALVEQVEVLGYKAIFLTVDAAVIGNRERDVKSVFALEDQEVEVEEDQDDDGDEVAGGVGGQLQREGEGVGVPEKASAALNSKDNDKGKEGKKKKRKYFVESEVQEEDNVNYLGTSTASVLNDDRDMTWDVVKWLRGVTKLPIVLKGIQSVEDAILAKEAGVDGIVLSNHGGRQLEYSIPPIELLYHIRTTHPSLLSPSPNPSHPTQRPFEIYIDGGLTRGTSILKAIALGATAAGLGRPFLYALSAYGESGVTKLLEILHREIITGMRLLGVSSIEGLRRLGPELVKRVDWESETMRIRERGERARL